MKAPTARLLRQLPAGRSFSSLCSWASLLSLLCLRSAPPSFQLRPQSTALSSLYCLLLHASPFPFLLAPSPLFLSLFTSSASPFLPIPPPPTTHISPLVPSLPPTVSRPHTHTSPPNNKNTQPGGKAPTPGAGREARGPGPQRRRAARARCGASGARPAPARRALCNRPSRLH